MYCLDTSALIELLRGSERGTRIKELLTGPASVTAFSVHELRGGARSGTTTVVDEFLEEFEIISYDAACARASAALEKALAKAGRSIGIIDTLIAGTCVAKHATLVTVDNDFKNVPELSVVVIS